MKFLGEIKELGKVNTLLRLGKETKGYLVFPNFIKFSEIFLCFLDKLLFTIEQRFFLLKKDFILIVSSLKITLTSNSWCSARVA